MIHVTCRLTVKNRGQLRDPTLGNRVWATSTFFTRVSSVQFMRREQTLRDQYSQVRKAYIIFFVQYAINYIYYDFSAIAKGRKLLSDMYT